MRLIDAEALMENIEQIPWFTKTKNGYLVYGAKSEVGSYLPTDKVWEAVNKAHTVDAEPARHGRWVYDPNGMDFNLGAWVCSECKVKNDNLGGSQRINPYHFVGSRYCPNCGAKMDGGKEHEAD